MNVAIMCDAADRHRVRRNCLSSACCQKSGKAGYPSVSARSRYSSATAVRRGRCPSAACTLNLQPSKGANPGALYFLGYSLVGAARRYPIDHSDCRSRGTIPRRETCTHLRHFTNYAQSCHAGPSPA